MRAPLLAVMGALAIAGCGPAALAPSADQPTRVAALSWRDGGPAGLVFRATPTALWNSKTLWNTVRLAAELQGASVRLSLTAHRAVGSEIAIEEGQANVPRPAGALTVIDAYDGQALGTIAPDATSGELKR